MPENNENQQDTLEYPHVSNMTPNILTQKHIRSNYAIIRLGAAADRPTSGNPQTVFYFSTDTYVLSYWTGSAWVDNAAFS